MFQYFLVWMSPRRKQCCHSKCKMLHATVFFPLCILCLVWNRRLDVKRLDAARVWCETASKHCQSRNVKGPAQSNLYGNASDAPIQMKQMSLYLAWIQFVTFVTQLCVYIVVRWKTNGKSLWCLSQSDAEFLRAQVASRWWVCVNILWQVASARHLYRAAAEPGNLGY